MVIGKATLATFTTVVIAGGGFAGAGVANASPDAPTCADIGAVFVAHGTDGRGDCMSADPRPKCHVPPDQQDAFDPTGNYVAELTITPPFPGGTLDPYDIILIEGASNRDCWKLPS
jgi:hypothetical protein